MRLALRLTHFGMTIHSIAKFFPSPAHRDSIHASRAPRYLTTRPQVRIVSPAPIDLTLFDSRLQMRALARRANREKRPFCLYGKHLPQSHRGRAVLPFARKS